MNEKVCKIKAIKREKRSGQQKRENINVHMMDSHHPSLLSMSSFIAFFHHQNIFTSTFIVDPQHGMPMTQLKRKKKKKGSLNFFYHSFLFLTHCDQ